MGKFRLPSVKAWGSDDFLGEQPLYLYSNHRIFAFLEVIYWENNTKCSYLSNSESIIQITQGVRHLSVCRVRGTSGSCNVHILSVKTINTLLATCAGIIVHYELDSDDDTAMYAVKGGFMFWTALLAQILFLIERYVPFTMSNIKFNNMKLPCRHWPVRLHRSDIYGKLINNDFSFSYLLFV